jgi:hypothetical protein
VHTVGDSYAFTRSLAADRVVIGPAGGDPAVEMALAAPATGTCTWPSSAPTRCCRDWSGPGLLIEDMDTVMSTTAEAVRFEHYLPAADLG